ncbi:MAG TPA: alginate lyase family protein, partial [Nitrospira sp.]|nr:alginate lyase family protein [Nitrospira sp.]
MAYFLLRRVLPQSPFVAGIDEASLRVGVSILPGITAHHSTGDDSHFCFLEQSKRVERGNVSWECRDMPKLWRYNLHYFDYLHDPQRSYEHKNDLLNDWIQHNPPGTEDAWEPYTVSLRIVNWIKFFLLRNGTSFVVGHEKSPRQEWIDSLYQQARWLERSIEYHFLANHYLKNGVALLFAGMYFEGADADRWLQKGLEILRDELKEQFLADGGHFERSPMYHSISVVDYLDVLNLTQNSSSMILRDVADEFVDKITTALDFLNGICLPDGDIPLFNDSALGIAPTPSQIFEYAERVIGYKLPQPSTSLTVSGFSMSGYYVCRKAGDMIIVDCGPIGPDYNPAHAHCDTLSYELAIDGRRVVVDSGVFDYEPSQERSYVRSTRAHNTITVDGEEQSEIWGVFRVARRARPMQAHIGRAGDESVLFEGAHDGYRRLKGKPIHKRQISYDGYGSWVVTDELTGTGMHHMESFVHIHPDLTIVASEDRI